MVQRTTEPAQTAAHRTSDPVVSILIGLAALAILLQGVWAGIFLEHDGERDSAGSWIDLHGAGGWVALILSGLACLAALVRLRHRRELWIGAAALTLLLIVQGFIGGQIRDESKDTLTAVHVPLGMALMALVTWLSVRSARPARPGR